MSENRTEPRFNVCLDVRSQSSATRYKLRIADISAGGCYVDSIIEVFEGEILFLNILMPEGEWFDVQGVVAHHTPRLGFGVRFINLDEAQRRRIRSLIPQVNPMMKESPESSLPFAQIAERALPFEPSLGLRYLSNRLM
jgi:c-di-GMP-binding flagellar brake protein YcgR